MKKFAKSAIAAALLVGATTPALAATTSLDNTFVVDFIDYIKATFALEGAEYSAFQSLNLPADKLQAISNSYAAVDAAQMKLLGYLQTQLSNS